MRDPENEVGEIHSRPQSLRSFWPAAGIESSGSNHYERTKEITEFWLSGSLRICIYGACLKWLLPELSIPAAGQKDRRLWGREWHAPSLGAAISGMRHRRRLRSETGWAEFGYFLCYFKMVAPRALDSCRRPEGS